MQNVQIGLLKIVNLLFLPLIRNVGPIIYTFDTFLLATILLMKKMNAGKIFV